MGFKNIVQWFNASKSMKTDEESSRTLFTSSQGLEQAKQLLTSYKTGEIRDMNQELWNAKKIVDSTLHPGKKLIRCEATNC